MTNILFTCAGRRNYLLQYFKETLKDKGRVVAADLQSTAPAAAVADEFISVPGVYSQKYVHTLLDICKKKQIRALVSLNDLELPVLAAARNRFEDQGTTLLISSEKVIDTCFDKWRTYKFAQENGFLTPQTMLSFQKAASAVDNQEIAFPLVLKPRWGSASIGIEFAETMQELHLAYQLLSFKISRTLLSKAGNGNSDHILMVQAKINGTEYGLDILNDFSGNPVQVYVKEKLAMRAGETDKAVLRNKPKLEEMGYEIGKALGHIGNLDCDVFESEGNYYLLEMNPRFGGGYPFSHMAGADYPAAIISWLNNQPFDFSQCKKLYDQPFAKCDTLVQVSLSNA